MNRIIFHIDMDAFFTSIEQRDHPEFKGKPVIVGADPQNGYGRGVVAAASYEARSYGVRSAMPISEAFRKCPNGIFLKPDGKRYVEASRQFMSIISDYTPVFEPVSLDEAFLDMTGCVRLLGSPADVGMQIKNKIACNLHLTASLGIGPNKLIAKIASDLDKPDGFLFIHENDAAAFLKPLSVNKIWGIGKKTESELKKWGIHTIGDLQSCSKQLLINRFGKNGGELWCSARGIDLSEVISMHKTKSISNEYTFARDNAIPEEHKKILSGLAEKIAFRLRAKKMAAKTIFLKLRYEDFSTFIRNYSLPEPGDDTQLIKNAVLMLYSKWYEPRRAVRLLGAGVTRLISASRTQISLFHDHKSEKLDITLDNLKNKYGSNIIKRG